MLCLLLSLKKDFHINCYGSKCCYVAKSRSAQVNKIKQWPNVLIDEHVYKVIAWSGCEILRTKGKIIFFRRLEW